MDAKDEIKQRLSIEDVVADYAELKRAGRNFKVLSPWTSEKTPSLMVSPDKQIWHDFSSNKGGDMFSFVMEMEGIGFRESLEVLARKAGVDLTKYDKPGAGGVAKKKKRIYEAHELAVRYYHQTLAKNSTALQYLMKDRQFTKETIQLFQLGYAPKNGFALRDFLTGRGFSVAELSEAGLLSKRGADMFRGRMMVPLADGQGRVVGFTGRILEKNPDAPKYLNTPQTFVYDKGRQAFGLHLAKDAIRTLDFVVITEGNLDVVASHQAGMGAVVAAAGTALTNDHLKQLARLTPNIRLAFDSDAAGIKATERAIGMAQGLDIELRIIDLPNGADPDDIIRENPQDWLTAVEKSDYVLDWLFTHYTAQYDITSATGKRKLSDRVLEVLARLNDPVERDHYVQQLANTTGVSVDAVRNKLTGATKAETPKRLKKTDVKPASPDKTAQEDTLLALNVLYPDVRTCLSKLTEASFSTDQRRLLFTFMVENPHQIFTPVPQELKIMEDYVKILVLKAEELYGSWTSDDRMAEGLGIARRIVRSTKEKTKTHLTEAIRRAEEAGNSDEASSLLAKYLQLLKED